jgi:hypothetical protein
LSLIPAKGRLASIARKKYGTRKDERSSARKELFQEIKPLVEDGVLARGSLKRLVLIRCLV